MNNFQAECLLNIQTDFPVENFHKYIIENVSTGFLSENLSLANLLNYSHINATLDSIPFIEMFPLESLIQMFC